MKLPNDLIKATDYDKAKDREIHEFECVNGKFIQHYVLGGEHELTMQEIVDCLNALATIDCDLQTAYAYIKGQEKNISDLEAKLAENKKWLASNEGFLENQKLKQQLAEKDEQIKLIKWDYDVVTREYNKLFNTADSVIERQDQDKISFAIEKLEKVKNEIYGSEVKFEEIEKLPIALNNYEIGYDKGRFKATNIIDNQIKQLKEGK